MDVKTTFRNLVRDQSVSICMLQGCRTARQATQAGGIDSLESIPGPLKSLKIRALFPSPQRWNGDMYSR